MVTELRCQYPKLVLVSAGNKISKVFEGDEEERMEADLQTNSRKDLWVWFICTWNQEEAIKSVATKFLR